VVSFGRAIHVWLIRQGDLIRDNKRKSILRECLWTLKARRRGWKSCCRFICHICPMEILYFPNLTAIDCASTAMAAI
jgi:hypothetical protein